MAIPTVHVDCPGRFARDSCKFPSETAKSVGLRQKAASVFRTGLPESTLMRSLFMDK